VIVKSDHSGEQIRDVALLSHQELMIPTPDGALLFARLVSTSADLGLSARATSSPHQSGMAQPRHEGDPDVLLLEPRVFHDERGFFLETWNERVFQNDIKLNAQFVQDKHSQSTRNVVRGLHYQIKQPQGKLVCVARRRIFDVAVDLRKSKPTFGQWVAYELGEDNHREL
jgi:hypothetical protein